MSAETPLQTMVVSSYTHIALVASTWLLQCADHVDLDCSSAMGLWRIQVKTI